VTPRLAALRSALCGAAALSAVACVFVGVREQQREIESLSRVSGHVTTGVPGSHPLVVLLVRSEGESRGLVDHFVVEGGGRWSFVVSPGTYSLGAFEDANENLSYDPGERALRPLSGPRFALSSGQLVKDVDLVIPDEGADVAGPIDVAELQARTPRDQFQLSLGRLSVEGEVVSLDDPRFDPQNGKLGLWRPLDFVVDVGPGIYFVDEHAPDRVPILFVHGIDGTPRQFETLIERLDRERFEPWLYYYPSGGHLDRVSDHLNEMVVALAVRHRVERLCVVAHSMGGLVARSFILKHAAGNDRPAVLLFVSISTPWEGHAAAQEGVEHAPAVVYSWRDVAPGSAFLDALFFEDPGVRSTRRRLPGSVPHHLLFGYRRNGSWPGPSGDGVVTESSQLRAEAQEEAAGLRGFDEDHTSILQSQGVSAYLGAVLGDALR
jgi:pimeloyl-ACP methyl ester carboxylesterase